MVFLRIALIVVIITAGLALMSKTATSATLMLPDKAADIASLQNLTNKDGEVAGEVVNHSKQTLRDVQLQIIYSWRWNNEYHPRADDPGRAVYVMVTGEIPPGQSARFSYDPAPPLPPRRDGYFEISIKVVGFAQVYR
jgi:hypothetical protein